MIDTNADPVGTASFSTSPIAIKPRTATLFNALAIGAAALAAVLPLGAGSYWLLAELGEVRQVLGVAGGALPELDWLQRSAAALIALLSALPLTWGLLRLCTCLSEFAKGRPFSPRGVAGLKDFAIGSALAALAKPVAFTLLTVVLSWNAGPGRRQIAIQLDSDTLLLALFAGTIAALAWAMEKAAALAEENSQFI